MANISLSILVSVVCLFVIFESTLGCAPTATQAPGTMGRRRRSADETSNQLKVLTEFDFNVIDNTKKAEIIEHQMKKFIQKEKQAILSNRIFSEQNGLLFITYSLSPASSLDCVDVKNTYETAFLKISEAVEANVVC